MNGSMTRSIETTSALRRGSAEQVLTYALAGNSTNLPVKFEDATFLAPLST
jgi:hypothetical protein